jgi:3'-phosphoadenosine 5'-phosphosulfate sulfotransferase (PAPS reductase)/FAD synthetase
MITNEELKYRLSWNINQKIDHSLGVIEQMLNHNKCYLSFSGGKDSVVLYDLINRYFPQIRKVFFNTTNEFPEMYQFLKTFNDVEWIQPEMNLKQVIEKYGFPLISKEQSQYIREARTTKSQKLLNLRLYGRNGNQGKIANKWQFLINAPFNISEKCCDILKKRPAKKFEKQTDLVPIIGTTVQESRLRFQKYLKTGCNSFEGRIASYPLSIWTVKDSWNYIRKFNIPYCSIYDKGETQTGCMFCGFGCQYDNRFDRLKQYHPIAYENCMNYKNNGISYLDAIKYTLKKIF